MPIHIPTPGQPQDSSPLPPEGNDVESAQQEACTHDTLEPCLKHFPEDLLAKVCITGREIHYSEELAGTQAFLQLAAELRSHFRQGEPIRFTSHPSADFAHSFGHQGLHAQTDLPSILQELRDIIAEAYSEGASDIHVIDTGSYGLIRMRQNGELRTTHQMTSAHAARLIAVAFNGMSQETGTTAYSPRQRNDGRISSRRWLPAGLFSVRLHSESLHSGANHDGTLLAMRLLYDRVSVSGSLETRLTALGYLDISTHDRKISQVFQMRLLAEGGGLTLIAGPTGHGKSTVLRHVLEAMVEERPGDSYLSVEDPPEYPIHGVHQIMVAASGNPESRARGYIEAIAGAMRSDPDHANIGEIRDGAAAFAAAEAAMTGHAVWASIHAPDAFAIVPRMASLLRGQIADPLGMLLSPSVLSGLVAQHLLPVLCPYCSRRFIDLSPRERAALLPQGIISRIGTLPPHQHGRIRLRIQTPSCPHCSGTGLSRRTAAAEVVVLTDELRRLLREGNYREARTLWEKQGGIPAKEAALRRIWAGEVDPLMAERCMGIHLIGTIPKQGPRPGSSSHRPPCASTSSPMPNRPWPEPWSTSPTRTGDDREKSLMTEGCTGLHLIGYIPPQAPLPTSTSEKPAGTGSPSPMKDAACPASGDTYAS